jgi:thioredoxin reductase (NADPH)
VTSITAKNVINEEESTIPVDGVFIFIGFIPNTQFMNPSLLNDRGEILVDMQMATAVPGMYAIGDVRADSKRQIVMACADGATAALNAYEYLQQLSC